MKTVRKSAERGTADMGWLKAMYSFSFANYFDPHHVGVSDLRVINEDWIAPGMGFGQHPHRDMEIVTYVVDGAIKHRDSMGNEGVVRHGEIQYMSAGTGITHSEFNNSHEEESHSLQIWILPDRKGHDPNYGQVSYRERLIPNELCLLISEDGREGSIKVNQSVSLYTSRLDSEKTISYTLDPNRQVWLQMIRGVLNVSGEALSAGDGLHVKGEEQIQMKAIENSEFLLFDLR